MGNIQCNALCTNDDEVDLIISSSSLSSGPDNAIVFSSASNHQEQMGTIERAFLQEHSQDRQCKVLLDATEITKALVEQTEELLRREKKEAIEDNSVTDVDVDEDEDVYSGVTETSIACLHSSHDEPSVVTRSRTEVTTMTADTQQAANSPRRRALPRVRQPPQMKGTNNFDAHIEIQDEVQSVLSISTRRNLGKPYTRGKPHRVSLYERATCGFSTCLGKPESVEHMKKVRKHMAVLYLKMELKCAPLFSQRYLPRLLPHNPAVQAISSGISSTDVSPIRSFRQTIDPPCLSRSTTAGIVYGVGPPSTPIRMLVTGSVFMDLAITGSLGLVSRRKSHPREVLPHRKQLSAPDHFLVLMHRRSGIPLAVCALKSGVRGPPVVRIYATKCRIYSQKASSTTRKLGLDWCEPLPLYAWAEIVSDGSYPDQVNYSIFMATGSDGCFERNESYRAAHQSSESPEILVLGRTEKETSLTGCAVLSMNRDERAADDQDVYFRLSIAKGIDPALMICFAAFLDEAMESSIGRQSESLLERR